MICSPNANPPLAGDDFRQVGWIEEIEYPEITLQLTQELLITHWQTYAE